MADIFPYYAGFYYEWAKAELAKHVEEGDIVVLDPWNGSGTTTLAAQSLGIPSIGVDLNPIANVIARLRIRRSSRFTVGPPRPLPRSSTNDRTDALRAWFTERTIRRIRDWTRLLASYNLDVAAPAYVSVFRVVRSLTKEFEGSNPTWVRRASGPDDLVDVSHEDLDEMIVEDQIRVASRLGERAACAANTTLVTGSSCALPVRNESVDLILTSPPYLTRIDYAIAYARELAVYGIDVTTERTLRSSLMGTTLIRPQPKREARRGRVAENLIRQVSSHRSKASSGYYRKQLAQYLNDLALSLDEITRAAKPAARAIIVVQDSYYKEIPIRLADICEDEASQRGWSCEPKRFKVNRILTSLNTGAKAYPKGEVHETVLTLTKGS